jgi:hypothetical protein
MNVLGKISLPVTKNGVSPTIRPPNDRVQSGWGKTPKPKKLRFPDLAPADYFLFPKLKFSLKWRHFQTVEEIQCAVTRELNNIKKKNCFPGGHEEVEVTCKQVY